MTNERSLKKRIRPQQWESARNSQLFDEINNKEFSVGKCLREIRAQQGLSMRALAEMSGLNINTLSLIENEHTSPSVSTLQQLAQSLQVNITEFFEVDPQRKKVVFQKQGQRPCVSFAHNTIEDLAAGMPRFGAEPIMVTLHSNAGSGKNPIVQGASLCIAFKDGYFIRSITKNICWSLEIVCSLKPIYPIIGEMPMLLHRAFCWSSVQ